MHLDAFQRIVVAPASISVIRYTPLRPFVERVNDTGDLGSISPYPRATESTPKEPTDAPPTETQPAGVPASPDTADVEASSDAVPGGVVR
jgi:probable phosphoglycerate mutase